MTVSQVESARRAGHETALKLAPVQEAAIVARVAAILRAPGRETAPGPQARSRINSFSSTEAEPPATGDDFNGDSTRIL